MWATTVTNEHNSKRESIYILFIEIEQPKHKLYLAGMDNTVLKKWTR